MNIKDIEQAEGRRRVHTTLVEKVYDTLTEFELVSNAEEFSTDWCKKSKSWFAERKHARRDFSISSAIDCLDKINADRLKMRMRTQRLGGLLDPEAQALGDLHDALKEFLNEQHRITEVRLSEAPKRKLLWK